MPKLLAFYIFEGLLKLTYLISMKNHPLEAT